MILKETVVRGTIDANISCSYRVMENYETNYNKLFVPKEQHKVWKKESNVYSTS